MSRMNGNAPPTDFSPEPNEVKDRVKSGLPPRSSEPIKSASSYAQRVQERRSATSALKGKGAPLGGAEPIPEGKLSALALPKPTFAHEDESPPPITQQEAIHGVGAAYPVNQALTRGDIKEPMTMREAKRSGGMSTGISEKTAEGLKAVKELNDKEDETQPEEGQTDLPEETALEEAEKDIADSAQIDFASLIGARNALLSEKRRKEIESRLESMDLADMITERELRQRIPIVPNKFEILLRTFSQAENLFCLRHLTNHPGSNMYQEEMLNTFKLVCAVVAVNGALLPEHRKDIGARTEAVDAVKFDEKFQAIAALPVQIVGDLSVQNIWFQRRVEKLFSWGNLKNG